MTHLLRRLNGGALNADLPLLLALLLLLSECTWADLLGQDLRSIERCIRRSIRRQVETREKHAVAIWQLRAAAG